MGRDMKVLVIGKSGRAHALVWKLRQSPRVDQVFCAPGNAGTGEDGVNVPIEVNDFDGLIRFAKKESIGLTVVGPRRSARPGNRRCVSKGRAEDIRPEQGGRPDRGQQSLRQEADVGRQRPHGGVSRLRSSRPGPDLCADPRISGRHQGGRPGCRARGSWFATPARKPWPPSNGSWSARNSAGPAGRSSSRNGSTATS